MNSNIVRQANSSRGVIGYKVPMYLSKSNLKMLIYDCDNLLSCLCRAAIRQINQFGAQSGKRLRRKRLRIQSAREQQGHDFHC